MKLEINTKYDVGDIAVINDYFHRKETVKILDIRLGIADRLEYLVEKNNKERVWVREHELTQAPLEQRIKNGIMMYFGNRCY